MKTVVSDAKYSGFFFNIWENFEGGGVQKLEFKFAMAVLFVFMNVHISENLRSISKASNISKNFN